MTPHPLARLADQSGALVAVGACFTHERYARLEFAFEQGRLALCCDDDTDEIVVSVSEPGQLTLGDASDAFADLIGLELEYAWELQNHRGYIDGFQLRLRDSSGREETVQFEVAASAIDVRRVSEAES